MNDMSLKRGNAPASERRIGTVHLVGAGPGDPELLTIRALRCLQTADAVVYDRLVSPEILALAAANAVKICVGKEPRRHPVPQERINAILAELAGHYTSVVRLKGGDPYIFGRGGEEALHLAEAGIPFTVVPGITAAQGVAASTGVPLTHRGLAQGVRYLTGHGQRDEALDLDWRGLADPHTTLVIYMGLAAIGEIAGKLIEHGLPATTPVLVVENATQSRERRLLGALGDIAQRVAMAGFKNPATILIGQVASLAAILTPAFAVSGPLREAAHG